MELKLSSPKLGGLSPECASDPEEKEVSDDDDDDRNHKHRRRETRSQSLERDNLDQVLTRPYRKRNKPFPNGHSFRENESQTSTTWKNYNSTNLEKDLSAKFDKRRTGIGLLPRAPFDVSQRIRANQAFTGDPGPGRGRGRDSGLWNQRDARFSADIASQMVQQGSIPGSLFSGRGLTNVSNAQGASWNAFGLIPGIPNGGLDALHSIGLQGTLRPAIHSSLNMGIPRQRCRDFEERGFCLRGDMCPMEHGVNRIVIEDVQSLSQFNLPVSLPSAHILGTTAGPGSLASVSASSTTSMNSKGLQNKMSKPGIADDGMGLNGLYPGSGCTGGADLYDPDQPLWNNNCPETSNSLLAIHSPKIDETEPLNGDPSDNECTVRSTGNAAGLQNTSVWGRIGGSKSRLEVKEKIDPGISSLDYLENETKEDKEALAVIQPTSRQGKRVIAEDAGPKRMESSSKPQFDTMRNTRKQSQKALRTLFVNGIPLKSNKREALLSHFQKFGEIIDIYIPMNSERAFVQFSKREEAEAALKAPDAVMGNRFIKLWWANRDSIPDDGISSSSSACVTPHGVTAVSVPPNPSVASSSKDNHQAAAPKSSVAHTQDPSLSASDNARPVISNGPKVQPPSQKKLETLEQLKEQLRKKQEMLDQKRNDFRRKLDKLEKQASGLKGESDTEQVAKRPKRGIAADVAKAATPRPSDPVPTVVSPHAETSLDKNLSGENIVSHSPKTNTNVLVQEPVAVLKEHFLPYDDLSNVELEDVETHDNSSESETSKDCSACITFTTRRSAERAFINGKCWEGHNLKFTWLPSSISSNDRGGKENSPSTPKGLLDADIHPGEKPTSIVSQEAASSGTVEADYLETESGVEHLELGENSQPTPSPTSDKKESPKGEML
ncbi:hypothetical protein FEM48_Zijuj04G0023700 [Ziziphus jujuba var. spinosa]|uniref:Zinc finger CCCH domain-containing protein 41 n=1 Tax=Ziziphus jujuba var. spinosa TaxID=714518 RepID=A0A978VHA4_ZIZJJ|nr:hypothetical protein FEM48_Zijuj04G0023700 [Ziziphus jujuba var. spinosa]